MRISDWSSDVCSSDLATGPTRSRRRSSPPPPFPARRSYRRSPNGMSCQCLHPDGSESWDRGFGRSTPGCAGSSSPLYRRSEEHTSELQSLMRISYAVFCLKKQTILYTHLHIDYI